MVKNIYINKNGKIAGIVTIYSIRKSKIIVAALVAIWIFF